jgi:hypothetical protein
VRKGEKGQQGAGKETSKAIIFLRELKDIVSSTDSCDSTEEIL